MKENAVITVDGKGLTMTEARKYVASLREESRLRDVKIGKLLRDHDASISKGMESLTPKNRAAFAEIFGS